MMGDVDNPIRSAKEAVSLLDYFHTKVYVTEEVYREFDWTQHLDAADVSEVYVDEDGYYTCGGIYGVTAHEQLPKNDADATRYYLEFSLLGIKDVEEIVKLAIIGRKELCRSKMTRQTGI